MMEGEQLHQGWCLTGTATSIGIWQIILLFIQISKEAVVVLQPPLTKSFLIQNLIITVALAYRALRENLKIWNKPNGVRVRNSSPHKTSKMQKL